MKPFVMLGWNKPSPLLAARPCVFTPLTTRLLSRRRHSSLHILLAATNVAAGLASMAAAHGCGTWPRHMATWPRHIWPLLLASHCLVAWGKGLAPTWPHPSPRGSLLRAALSARWTAASPLGPRGEAISTLRSFPKWPICSHHTGPVMSSRLPGESRTPSQPLAFLVPRRQLWRYYMRTHVCTHTARHQPCLSD